MCSTGPPCCPGKTAESIGSRTARATGSCRRPPPGTCAPWSSRLRRARPVRGATRRPRGRRSGPCRPSEGENLARDLPEAREVKDAWIRDQPATISLERRSFASFATASMSMRWVNAEARDAAPPTANENATGLRRGRNRSDGVARAVGFQRCAIRKHDLRARDQRNILVVPPHDGRPHRLTVRLTVDTA